MRILVFAFVLFLGLSACFGGWALMEYPSGQMLQMPTQMLENSPFADFFWPGLILFVILGLGSLLVAGLIFRRVPNYHRWVILLGLSLVIWIGMQLIWLSTYSWLQLLYGGLGLVLVALGFFLPSLDAEDSFA